MNHKGVLVVVSGFSGVGKGTIMRRLVEKYPGYALSVSATTRAPREGETDGVDYFFRTREEFRKLIAGGGLMEYACYCDNYYGTPRSYVEKQLDQGKNVLLEIEIQGALKIKAQYPDAILVFVMPPNGETLRQRLTGRGTETQEVIEARLERAKAEADGIDAYDYIIVNDELEGCVDRLHELVCCQRWRVENNESFIETVRTEIKEF